MLFVVCCAVVVALDYDAVAVALLSCIECRVNAVVTLMLDFSFCVLVKGVAV